MAFIFHFGKHKRGDGVPGQGFNLERDGDPINLTGASITCQFAHREVNGQITRRLAIGTGITVTDAAAGAMQIDDFVADLLPGIHHYAIRLTAVASLPETVVEGTIEIISTPNS